MSPQEEQAYQLLLAQKTPISVVNLADKLKIVPSSIYRLINPLIDLGVIEKTKDRPQKLKAKPLEEALPLFLLSQSNWFSQKFTADSIGPNPAFSFIQGRDELMHLSTEEYRKTTNSVDLLRSGGEIPADLMLEMINSGKRGVTTRMLIQDYSSENAAMVQNWIKNGLEVKVTPLRQIRLMIYDRSTIYFMSYRYSDSGNDMGMKIVYPPLAAIMVRQFDEWWKNATSIYGKTRR